VICLFVKIHILHRLLDRNRELLDDCVPSSCLIFLFCRYKNQNVAVKIINKGETPEQISRREARFGREIAMLSRVQHKNLVKVGLPIMKAFLFAEVSLCIH